LYYLHYNLLDFFNKQCYGVLIDSNVGFWNAN
jgi:hypothetical protein